MISQNVFIRAPLKMTHMFIDQWQLGLWTEASTAFLFVCAFECLCVCIPVNLRQRWV